MNRFREEELVRFFTVLDQKLDTKETLFLIGGAAVLISKHTGRMTKDVDTWMRVPQKIREIWPLVVQETGIDLRIEISSVAEAAHDMEARAEQRLAFKNLIIFTPSSLDLLIMKLPRFSDTDRQDISALAKGLKPQKLLTVFKNEFLPYCMGNKRMVALSYLQVIEEIFGEDEAAEHAEVIGFNNI